MIKASNNQIKLLRKLSQRKHRDKEQLFIVEGERAVNQISEHKLIEIVSVFVDEDKSNNFKLPTSGFVLDQKTFLELSDTDSPQGILAVCKMPESASLDQIGKQDSGVIVATDAIQDPGNLGTIIRTASWFGCKSILLGSGTVDLFNPKVVRSTMGATGSLPFLSAKLEKTIPKLEQLGWQTLLLDGNTGATPLMNIKKPEKIILVVGNEANGINKELITPSRKRVLIPSENAQNSVESLNAAVALSIALWSVHN